MTFSENAAGHAKAPATPREHRAIEAVRQIAVALAVVTVLWIMARVLTPDVTVDGRGARNLLTMPFVATCAALCGFFAMNAFAFDDSQVLSLGSRAPMAGVTAGALWFVMGVLTINTFGLAAVLYLFFAGLLIGTLVASVGLCAQLIVRKLAD